MIEAEAGLRTQRANGSRALRASLEEMRLRRSAQRRRRLRDDDEVVYYHSNTLYSVCALTDDGENVVERMRYDAYGAATVLDSDFSSDADGASDVENPYTFTGRRLDLESDLMQYRNRCYDPGLGRFVSRDPSGYADGFGLFEYAGSRPVGATDASGLASRGLIPQARKYLVHVGNNVHISKARARDRDFLAKAKAAAKNLGKSVRIANSSGRGGQRVTEGFRRVSVPASAVAGTVPPAGGDSESSSTHSTNETAGTGGGHGGSGGDGCTSCSASMDGGDGEEECSICGPGITEAFLQYITSVAYYLMTKVPDDKKGPIDGLFTLREIGWNIDFWYFGRGKGDCPTRNCENSVTFCGKCVRASVPNNILYGIVASSLGVAQDIAVFGAQIVDEGWDEGPEQEGAYDIGYDIGDWLEDPANAFTVPSLCGTVEDSYMYNPHWKWFPGSSLRAASKAFSHCRPCNEQELKISEVGRVGIGFFSGLPGTGTHSPDRRKGRRSRRGRR